MSRHSFKLYIMGSSDRSDRAIENLKRFCDEEIPENYDLIIIDVLLNPADAEKDKIFATPTLVKNLPPPMKRIIGDMTDRDLVMRTLNIQKATSVG